MPNVHRALVALGTLALALVPSLALAAPDYNPSGAGLNTLEPVRCAVGYTGAPDQFVVVTVGTTPDQTLVDDAAGLCTDLIASGGWTGANKDWPWQLDRNVKMVCIATVGTIAVADINVYAAPDVMSTADAYAMCGVLKTNGAHIVYVP